MQNMIIEELTKLEASRNVSTLYACEAGSRATGLASESSDYDVRFLYLHPADWYLSIQERRDVINTPVSKMLDLQGWDLRKALQLLRKSNPGILEWLHSGIIYTEIHEMTARMKELAAQTFSPKACTHHYFHMARRNFKDFLEKEEVQLKRYFYVLRPILSCLWMEKHGQFPPLDFPFLLQNLSLSSSLKNQIKELISKKSGAEKGSRELKNADIFLFAKNQLSHIEEILPFIDTPKQDCVNELDELFRWSLQKVWKK